MPICRRSGALDGERIQLGVIAFITVLAFFANISGLILGLSVITPLLFYLPIILAAYWYPRWGVLFSVGVGILEVFFVFLYSYPSLPDVTYAVTTASFYVLVAIAVVISSLSGNLKEREERYRGIFDHSEMGIFLVRNGDKNLIIEEANAKGAILLGCLPEDLTGQSLSVFWKDREARESLLGSLTSGIAVSQMESVVKGFQGDEIPVLISGSPLPERLMVLTFTDISIRKKQEEEIISVNRQLSTINTVIADASVAVDVESMLKIALTHIMGMLEHEFGGISILSENGCPKCITVMHGDCTLFPENPADASQKAWKESIEKMEPFTFTREFSADESVNGAGSGIAIPLRDNKEIRGVLFLANREPGCFSYEEQQILESLAREIATAATRLYLAERLIDANRKANLYLDILMHDINNANLASLWYGDLLLEMLEGETREMAEKMIDGIQKSREIIRNLETIRRIQERKNELKPVELDQVIRKEIRLFPDGRINYTGIDVRVWADDLLGEIFTNLVGNSLKFGGSKTDVEISVSPPVEGMVRVSVSDKGPGIPNELKRVIFRRFSQAENQGSGKGLGLFIVKTLLDRYGGTIQVEDRVLGHHDQGTIFVITLRQAAQNPSP